MQMPQLRRFEKSSQAYHSHVKFLTAVQTIGRNGRNVVKYDASGVQEQAAGFEDGRMWGQSHDQWQPRNLAGWAFPCPGTNIPTPAVLMSCGFGCRCPCICTCACPCTKAYTCVEMRMGSTVHWLFLNQHWCGHETSETDRHLVLFDITPISYRSFLITKSARIIPFANQLDIYISFISPGQFSLERASTSPTSLNHSHQL